MSLKRHRQDWEALGDLAPFWAMSGERRHKSGAVDVDEFFMTGEREISRVMEVARQLGHPARSEMVLDFGCGLGRMTRALATHFACCIGVDIAESMVARAKEWNEAIPNCTFIVNTNADLRLFPDRRFDMVYSVTALQTIPSRSVIMAYIAEFVRILSSGGLLMFQLPSYIAPRHRLHPRRRLYATLRAAGLSERYLLERLHIYPNYVNFIPLRDTIAQLRAHGAKILEVQTDSPPGAPQTYATYYATK